MDLTQERYDRLFVNKLTKYSLSVVLDAAREYEAAESGLKSASAKAWAEIDAFLRRIEMQDNLPEGKIRNLINWHTYLDDKHIDIYDAMLAANNAPYCNLAAGRMHGNDMFPVSSWRKVAASQRAATRKIEKLLVTRDNLRKITGA